MTLGGAVYTVGQLRLCDLAELQDFLERVYKPHPYLERWDEVHASEGKDRERILLQIRRADYSWPPIWGGDEANRVFASVGGMAKVLQVVLSRYQDVTLEDCLKIANAMKDDPRMALEFQSFVYDIAPGQRFYSLINPSDDSPDEFDPLRAPQDGWGAAIDEICRERHLDYAVVGEWTISQYRAAKNKGNVVRGKMVVPKMSPEELREHVRKERELLQGSGD
jgi:hypothetical protein